MTISSSIILFLSASALQAIQYSLADVSELNRHSTFEYNLLNPIKYPQCNLTDLNDNEESDTPHHQTLLHPNNTPSNNKSIGSFTQHECFENPLKDMEQHCLYVDPRFSDNRGISFFTRPSLLTQKISQLQLFKQPQTKITESDRASVPFKVASVPNKGRGAISTRKISKGELILSDYPVTVFDMETTSFNRSNLNMICKSVIELLPQNTQLVFKSLDSKGETDSEKARSAIDRNGFSASFGMTDEDQVLHFAVVPEPSIINHDCRPNSVFHFVSSELQVYVYAVRDIQVGQEITISYRDMKASKADRQHLISHYGFKCECDQCSLNETQSIESDLRIERIKFVFQQLTDFGTWSKANLDLADELIQLYQLESFEDRMSEAFTISMMTYNSFGDFKNASKFAKLAHQHGLRSFGTDWLDLKAVEEIMIEPKLHWTYNLRTGMNSRILS